MALNPHKLSWWLLDLIAMCSYKTSKTLFWHITAILKKSFYETRYFVLFSQVEISQTMALHVTLLIFSENFWWIGVQWFGLRLFGAMVWKILTIEPFFQWKLNKIKIESYIVIWGH
jgi:predicted CDP-diglyceride synthetase/phosphatidate cytidylyltransferase